MSLRLLLLSLALVGLLLQGSAVGTGGKGAMSRRRFENPALISKRGGPRPLKDCEGMAPNGITCENLNQRMCHWEEKDACEEH